MAGAQRSQHDNKYDRQMRLWGGHGQKKLETAHILCFGSGPSASETLKNLVLPNVGQFTLVDDAKVTDADTGNNFFVDTEQIGKPRAQVVTEFLSEMNPDVKGNAVIKDPREVANAQPAFFKQFNVVIAACQDEPTVLKLAASCAAVGVPFIVVRAYGLLGYVRTQLQEHRIIESHYDNDRYDFYLHPKQLQHFPELVAFAHKFNYEDEKMDGFVHGHVPYPVILIREMERWLAEHKQEVPATYDDKKAFKAQVWERRRKPKKEGEPEEENFEEALNFAVRAYDLPTWDADTKAVLDDPKAQNLTKDSPSFWILCNAINRFVKNEGHGFLLPTSNNLPDVVSETQTYLDMRAVYKTRADRDLSAIWAHTQAILKELQLPENTIPPEEVEFFVKNARGIRVVRERSLAEEYNAGTFNKAAVQDMLEDFVERDPEAEVEVPINIHWYFALRAADLFQQKFKRYPGVGGNPERDAEQLYELQTELITALGLSDFETKPEPLQEVARWGATEIHNIAAFVGGIGAQATLKILLQQYVPLNNTLLFNGVIGGCQSMRL